jgi:hypothetical protein
MSKTQSKTAPAFALWHIWDNYHAIRKADGSVWRGPDGNLQWNKPQAQAYLADLKAGRLA